MKRAFEVLPTSKEKFIEMEQILPQKKLEYFNSKSVQIKKDVSKIVLSEFIELKK